MNWINKKTTIFFLVMLIIASFTLTSFAQEKTLTFARAEDMQWMDPYDNHNITNNILDYLVYDRLVDYDYETDGQFVPALATEWNVSPDGKEYTFKLREGVKFHNGEPFDALSVKVSLERFINEKTLRLASMWQDLEEVEIVDDYTVILKCKEPVVYALYNLIRTPIIPGRAFQEKGTELFQNPVGTGAFTWGHWTRGQEIVVHKNPDYWGEPAYMDKFVYLPIMETSTRLAGVLTGEIDVVDDMTADQIPIAEASGNVDIHRMLAWDQVYIAIKTGGKEPLNDVKFRKAIDLALDKEGIVEYVMKGGRVATGINPKGCFGFDDSLVPVKQDIEKAKQLLAESTYDGREIDIMVPIGWFPNEREVAQAVMDNLQEIGIKCKLSILEGATFAERRSSGDYEMFLNQDAQPGDIGVWLMRVIYSDIHGFGNINPKAKELILEQARTVDIQKRIELLREIEEIINADCGPMVMICQFDSIYFQQKGLKGAKYFSDKAPDFRYAHYE